MGNKNSKPEDHQIFPLAWKMTPGGLGQTVIAMLEPSWLQVINCLLHCCWLCYSPVSSKSFPRNPSPDRNLERQQIDSILHHAKKWVLHRWWCFLKGCSLECKSRSLHFSMNQLQLIECIWIVAQTLVQVSNISIINCFMFSYNHLL